MKEQINFQPVHKMTDIYHKTNTTKLTTNLFTRTNFIQKVSITKSIISIFLTLFLASGKKAINENSKKGCQFF